MLRFPGLRSLKARDVHHSESINASMTMSRRHNPLTQLEISNCRLASEEIAFLLSGCPQLRHLLLHWDWATDAHYRVDWPDIGNALVEHCPLLEWLGLDSEAEASVDFEHELKDKPYMDNLGRLKELVHLRSITVSRLALFGRVPLESNSITQEFDERAGEGSVSLEGGLLMSHAQPLLSSVLPDSVVELTLLVESTGLSVQDEVLFADPFVGHLSKCTIVDIWKEERLSKDSLRNANSASSTSASSEANHRRSTSSDSARSSPKRLKQHEVEQATTASSPPVPSGGSSAAPEGDGLFAIPAILTKIERGTILPAKRHRPDEVPSSEALLHFGREIRDSIEDMAFEENQQRRGRGQALMSEEERCETGDFVLRRLRQELEMMRRPELREQRDIDDLYDY